MGSSVRLVILSEDRQQEMFARGVAVALGVDRRRLRFETCPKGSEAGDAWVRAQYAKEVKAWRARRHAQPKLGLMVMVDADLRTVEKRKSELDQHLHARGQTPRDPGEAIVIIVPKRNIETWLRHLGKGLQTDEEADYKKQNRPPMDCRAQAARFVQDCRNGLHPDHLPSLIDACGELLRLQSP